MRKIILVGFFVTILTTLNGQDYFPFPTSNADWNVLLIYGGMDEPPDTSLLRYSIDGNIEISELHYSIIYKETGDTISPVVDTIGFIREENKIIYYMGQDFLDLYIVEEIILYDFFFQAEDGIRDKGM